MKLDNALKKISALGGVKATFVFDHTHAIVARDMPDQYSNEVLKHIATQLAQLSDFSKQVGIATREFRLVYSKYAIYVRRFAKFFHLVVFMDKDMQPQDFRQPFNLATLVLEKTLRSEDAAQANTGLSKVAIIAEQFLREKSEKDDTFAGQFRKICVKVLGQAGRDLVDFVIEEGLMTLPLRRESDMRKLQGRVLSHIHHPLKRKMVEIEADALLKKILSAT